MISPPEISIASFEIHVMAPFLILKYGLRMSSMTMTEQELIVDEHVDKEAPKTALR